MKITVSVVIPIFNEEKNIPILFKRLEKTLKKLTSSYEIIFINDGSHDKSLQKLKELRNKNKKVKIATFSRNFGHMSAVNAGLVLSLGEKVIIMDADLQDPPEVIEKMWHKSKEGYQVIYGIKEKRKENFVRKFLFSTFYKILNNISSYKMPLDAGTFSLLDRKIVNILINLPEKNKYISGLRAWTGFKQTGIVYERAARYSGKPMSIRKLTKLAMDGMISFSYLPLRLASFFGFICATLAIIAIIGVIILRIFFGWGIIGWASTLTTILLVSGVQLITLGIIGEYLARIYDEVKGRPEYIFSEKIGFKK
ncbi:glycosyltransferase family 2 protein [Candidatus Microgenomates bacterium]|nr:glycosyltransferase family 2 protein [Candidatus Microgenomates bacterium]